MLEGMPTKRATIESTLSVDQTGVLYPATDRMNTLKNKLAFRETHGTIPVEKNTLLPSGARI